jgi:hypothetical protein
MPFDGEHMGQHIKHVLTLAQMEDDRLSLARPKPIPPWHMREKRRLRPQFSQRKTTADPICTASQTHRGKTRGHLWLELSSPKRQTHGCEANDYRWIQTSNK